MPTLSAPLAFPLGAALNPAPPAVGHVEKALDLLIEQYKGLPNIEAFMTALANETQAALDAANQLFSLTSIDDSQGVNLDNIGARVGEPRQGFDDVVYRLHLKARILLNRSSGTTEDILGLFATLLGPDATLTLQEFFPAALWLTIGGLALDPTLAPYLVNFLRSAKVGGVRPILQWSENLPEQTFAFAGGPGIGFDSGVWASAR
jgi:hypothetical protein